MELYSFYFFEIFFPTQHKALTSTQIAACISSSILLLLSNGPCRRCTTDSLTIQSLKGVWFFSIFSYNK